MSTFKTQGSMPLELLDLRTRVQQNKGLHYNFPYGIRYTGPSPGSKTYFTQVIPAPLFVGWTMRGFFYAPEASTTVSEFRMYYWSGTYHYFASSLIEGTKLSFGFSGVGLRNYDTRPTAVTVDAPGYYSVAIRVTDLQNLAMHYNDKEEGKVYQEKIINYTWDIDFKGGVHYLLSLHLSDEVEANPNFPATNYGQSYYLDNIVLGVGSYWVMTCIVRDTSQPLTLSIKEGMGNTSFPFTNVNPNDEITIHIRSSREGWLVTTSFDGTTNLLKNSAVKYIRPTVSNNCEIVSQYCEQAAERY